jgi:thiamine biosynthesis lipoprotein
VAAREPHTDEHADAGNGSIDTGSRARTAVGRRPHADHDARERTAHHGRADPDDAADRRDDPAAAAPAAALHRDEVPVTATRLIDVRDPYWSERVVGAMGSTAHIIAGDAPAGVVDWATDELERLEQCWSRFRTDSELARLNARGGTWTDVSAAMLLALTCAADLWRASAGRFDPTIIDALERAGYDRTFASVRDAGDDGRALDPTASAVPGFAGVEIDEEASRVRLPAGTRIDLGGVGKGLAADLVARGLTDRGARTALVGLGGDLRARGDAPDGAWRIPVAHPADDSVVAFEFPLVDDAIVTSSTFIRRWTRAGRGYHHLIDPATGDSARTDVVAVVASARDAWWAEGIAKSIIVGGLDEGLALADETNVRVWMFLADGQMLEHGPSNGQSQ